MNKAILSKIRNFFASIWKFINADGLRRVIFWSAIVCVIAFIIASITQVVLFTLVALVCLCVANVTSIALTRKNRRTFTDSVHQRRLKLLEEKGRSMETLSKNELNSLDVFPNNERMRIIQKYRTFRGSITLRFFITAIIVFVVIMMATQGEL